MKAEFRPGERAVLVRGPGQAMRPELAHLEGQQVLIIGALEERELFQDLERTYAVPTWCYRVSAGSHRFCVQPFNLARPSEFRLHMTDGVMRAVRKEELGEWDLCPWRPSKARR